MPSSLPGFVSGGSLLVSGNPWSGNNVPIGGIQLKLAFNASGRVYVALSGNVTITSGGALASGGMNDGVELSPGEGYFIPKLGASGIMSVFVAVPPAASGQCRIFWEAY